MIISSKLCRKKIGHRVRLGENDLLFLWQALSHRETAMLLICPRYERALMTQEIVRGKDAQCNTEESPQESESHTSSSYSKKLFEMYF